AVLDCLKDPSPALQTFIKVDKYKFTWAFRA
ncbi:MAG: hypothetical protein RIS61_771, partial [Actinomycetota bacterium]